MIALFNSNLEKVISKELGREKVVLSEQ